MKPAGRVIFTAAAIAGVTLVLYAWRLGDAPIHLSPDEAIISVDAHTLATTGRDVHGTLLPLFFRIQLPGESRMGWFTPVIFYLSALVLKVLPLSEGVVRIPSMLVGVVNIVLMYFIGRRLFQTEALAIVAAALLALTPAHFILSRYALDYLYPLPFVLGWFLCLLTFLDTKRPAALFVGTLLLGVGVYSYIAALVLMPMYFLATCIVVLREPRRLQLLGACAVGFGLPLLFLAGWLIGHPTAFTDTAARYELYDTKHLNALQGLRSFLSYTNVDRLASLYWSFFNPSFLFFTGDRQSMFSTKLIGVFTLPIAFLLTAGIYSVVSRPLTTRTTLVFLGFVTAPLAALLGSEDNAITRAVTLLPFTVLLATYGIEFLWSASLGCLSAISIANRFSLSRVVAIGLLVLIPTHFALFYRDYFTDYRLRSSPWLGGNLRGALETLIEMEEQQHTPRIYFAILASTSGLMDIRNRWMSSYWQFYLIKNRREDLLARSGPFEMGHVHEVPPGSLVLANIGEVNTDSLVTRGELKRVRMIAEGRGAGHVSVMK